MTDRELWNKLIEGRQHFRDGCDEDLDPYNPSMRHIANSNRAFGFSVAMEVVAEFLNIEMEY